MKDKFIIFLVQNRALNKFKNNLTEDFYEYIDQIVDPGDYILLAFDWELNGGDGYWGDLSDQWRGIALNSNN